jgi:PAS domain S-box-containing protein
VAVHTAVRPEETALSLTMAMVEVSRGPLLLLDGDSAIVAASLSFRELSGLDYQTLRGRKLSDLGWGEWDDAELRYRMECVVKEGRTLDGYDMEFLDPDGEPREIVIHAERLVYLDLENVRLLVAIADVTAARADRAIWQQAVKHSALLLQEVRHRVANSLHLIANILLRDARESRSEEIRTSLREAHDRVMSVAALERQLAGSGAGKVELRTYFESLCENVTASVVGDGGRVSLRTVGPGGVVEGRLAINVGLIATELMINALKHAFPADAQGEVIVSCNFPGPNWEFSVTDNGVGAPIERRDGQGGLGATIVQALANELGATVKTEPALPGIRVTVTRAAIALVDSRRGMTTPRPDQVAARRRDSKSIGDQHGHQDGSLA